MSVLSNSLLLILAGFTYIAIARLSGSEAVGIYATAGVVILTLGTLLLGSVPLTLTRTVARFHQANDMAAARRAMSSLIFGSGLLAAGLGLLCKVLAAFAFAAGMSGFNLPPSFWAWLPLTLPLAIWGMLIPNYYVGLLAMRLATAIPVVNPVVTLLVFFFTPGSPVERASSAAVAGAVGAGLAGLIAVIWQRDLVVAFSAPMWARMLREGLGDLPFLYILSGWMWIERLVLTNSLGPRDLGRFVAVAGLVQLITRIPLAVLANVAVTATAHAAVMGEAQLARLLKFKLEAMPAVLGGAMLTLAPVMTLAVKIAYGPEFAGLTQPVYVLMIGALAMSVLGPVTSTIGGLGLGRLLAKPLAFVVAVQIIAMYIVSKSFGLGGAVLASSGGLWLLTMVLWVAIGRRRVLGNASGPWGQLLVATLLLAVELTVQLRLPNPWLAFLGLPLGAAYAMALFPSLRRQLLPSGISSESVSL